MDTSEATLNIEKTIRCRRIGNSLGIILPSKIISGLSLQEGDEIHLVVKDGILTARPCEEENKKILFNEISAFLDGKN